MRYFFWTLIIIGIFTYGCSSGGAQSPITPSVHPGEDLTPSRITTESGSHHLWGLWEFTADPEAGTLDFVPLRSGSMHVNVVPFLEPPAGDKLSISNLSFDGLICNVDVSLTHPFPGMSEYIGFDVTGIMMSVGTMDQWQLSGLISAGSGDTRILNPDGYTRWWNPKEFSVPGAAILRYKDGLLGTPHDNAAYNCTLNGYKLFSDDLDAEDDILSLDPSNRLHFRNGYTNTRHYHIDFNGGLKFNYAVDANWEPIEGNPPFEPEDYLPEANRPEAWAISVTEVENSLWYDGGYSGGDLKLLIDVYDHYNANQNFVWLDSPGNFDFATALSVVGGGEGFSTYQVDILNAHPSPDEIEILVGVESEAVGYWDVLPDDPICGYFMYAAGVGGLTPLPPTAIMEATSPTGISEGETVSFDASASTGTSPLTFEWDFNGDDIYGGPEDDYVGDPETPTHQWDVYGVYSVTVKVSNDYGEDISDAVAVQVGFDPDDTYVDGDYTGGDSDGTMEKPYLTIQEGMADVLTGHVVHVDFLDGGTNTYDTNGLTLKSNVTLRGDNWNGGGPGKPKMDNDAGTFTIGVQYSSISDFTLEGFEVGIGELTGNTANYGIYFSGGTLSNITIRHNNVTDMVDDTGKTSGPGMPIYLGDCDNGLVEFNDVGPITWESETPGVYARVLWGMYFNECTNTEVKNNFIHDITIDYDGDGTNWGQIRVFLLHCYRCLDIDVHNNLICHVEGVNDYDYRIEGMMIEGYSGPQEYHYYNNTIDSLDHSTSDGGFPLRGIFIYANDAPGTYINNTLISNFDGPGSWSSIQTYFSSPADIYDVTYSTGYNQDAATDYFYNLIEGDGVTEYPGIDPEYIDAVNQPYDYHFQAGSGCEMGDPNFIDWDDTGAPSGNPDEADEENRSRMGCFGGPDGDWDPYDL